MVLLQMNLLVCWQIWILFWFMDDIWKIRWFWICWAVSWPRESLNSVFGLFYCVMCRNNKLSAIWNRERSTSANIWKSLPLIRAATSPMCAHHSGLKLKILLGNGWGKRRQLFCLSWVINGCWHRFGFRLFWFSCISVCCLWSPNDHRWHDRLSLNPIRCHHPLITQLSGTFFMAIFFVKNMYCAVCMLRCPNDP